MMTTKYIHRIPVAEEFLVPIGEAICVCQYLDGGLRDIGRKFQSDFYIKTIDEPSGRLVIKLKKVLEDQKINKCLKDELDDLCEQAEAIFKLRNEVVHSHGYTTLEGEQSRLYRSERRKVFKYLEPTGIETFIQKAADIALKANTLLYDDRMPQI